MYFIKLLNFQQIRSCLDGIGNFVYFFSSSESEVEHKKKRKKKKKKVASESESDGEKAKKSVKKVLNIFF